MEQRPLPSDASAPEIAEPGSSSSPWTVRRSTSRPRSRPRPSPRTPTTSEEADALDAAAQTQDPLKLYVRQIGDGPLLTRARGARARPAQGRGRRGGEAPADRVRTSGS